ncbi:MAG: adenosine deaminase [Bulleidia sp.]|nr:adenosine deaminase [Bulleidia sp.]
MVPALTELHLHLDGSLYLPWAYETAKRQKAVKDDCTFEDFYMMMYRTDYKTTEEAFLKFDLTCACMQTKKDLHDSVYYLARELQDLGIIYAEVRFASQQHCLGGLSQDEVVSAVLSGVSDAARDYPRVMIRIINCLMHKGNSAKDNDAQNRETIEVTGKYLGKGVVGLDLAGYENNCPFEEYAYLFEIARGYGIPYTIHAGEMGEGKHVMQALDMHADRIGHGIDCVQDESWLKRIVEEQVPLEVCPTSNLSFGFTYVSHPVRQLLEAGAKVTINSDNMMFSQTCASNEYLILSRMGVSDAQLMQCTYNAIDAAFCTEEEKKDLRRRAAEIYADHH